MTEFYCTPAGRNFVENTMPRIAKSLETIAREVSINSNTVEITEDAIYIRDSQGEITSWTQQEWEDEPEVVISIANAIKVHLTGGDLRGFLRRRCSD